MLLKEVYSFFKILDHKSVPCQIHRPFSVNISINDLPVNTLNERESEESTVKQKVNVCKIHMSFDCHYHSKYITTRMMCKI